MPTLPRPRRFLRFLLVTLLAVGLFFSGYLFGHGNLKFDRGFIPSIVNRDVGRPNDIDFSLFWSSYELLKEHYIGTVNPQDFLYGAMRGAVAALKDPYTVFLTPKEVSSFKESLSGEFEGIGIEIAVKDDKLTVIAPLEGSPAKNAGVRAADLIDKIEDTSTEGMSVVQAVQLIRGKAGTSVTLSVLHQGEKEPVEITIVRQKVVLNPVRAELKGSTGVIAISEFSEKTVKAVEEALRDLKNRGATGFVIDLRDNPGGFLDSAVDVSSFFLENKVVVIEEDKGGKRTELKTTKKALELTAPLVVLIDSGSASASEIVAGALQDHKRATIAGVKSFGKGSVQEFEDLPDHSAIKVTIARWLTPNGTSISEKGITPDVTVERSPEDRKADRDPQLEKALELVKQ